ncbi:MAG TPA: hypothetical protein ENH43_02310, partial [Phycisphaerales bacterium]|nr:hypothetical protein [Phycisphaerales bacterium]
MVKKKDLLILLAVVVTIAIAASPALAATPYYVKNGGNDDADGLSDANAWATIYKVNQQTFAAGDEIRFKSGDMWRTSREVQRDAQLYTRSGDITGDVTYTSYGTGPKPLFLGSMERNNTTDWAASGTNIWTTLIETTPINYSSVVGNIIFNNGEFCGHREDSIANLSAEREFYYDRDANTLYLYSSDNPATNYSDIECAIDLDMVNLNDVSYVKVNNLDLRYGARHGVHITGATNNPSHHITVSDCDISYIGGGDQLYPLRLGNGIQIWNSANNIVVERNKVWEIYDAALTNQSGSDFAYNQYNIYFQYNVAWNSAYLYEYLTENSSTTVDNIYVQNNTFVNAGDGWSYPEDIRGYALRFWNAVGTVGSNFQIRNNIIYQNNDNTFLGPENRCFILPTDIPELDLNNNSWYFYNWNVPTAGLIDYLGTVYTVSGFSDYQAATGWDSNSIVASIAPDDANDPDFVDIASNNYRLQASSPCIDIGWDVGLTQDFDLNPIVPAGFPDIGAFEYQSAASSQASNPSPADSATNVAIDANLGWTAGVGAVSHDVYFGTNETAVANADNNSPEFKGNQTEITYDPTLDSITTYYWAIDEIDVNDVVTDGVVWSFTTVQPPEPIGLWDMNEASWNGTAGEVNDISTAGLDNSGYAYNPNSIGPLPNTTNDPERGQVGSFPGGDGTNGAGLVYIPSNSSQDISYDLTMAAWINIGTAGNNHILSKGSNTAYKLHMSNGQIKLTLWDASSGLAISYADPNTLANPVPVGDWHHVAAVADFDTSAPNGYGYVYFYLDGSLSSTVDLAQFKIQTNTWILTIGAATDLGHGAFDGLLSEVRLYNAALTAAQIAEIYGVIDTNAPAAPTNLAATAGDGQVSLNWDDNSETDLAGYNVYRSQTSGVYDLNTPVNGTSLVDVNSYVDTPVTNDVNYFYVVTAVDISNNESVQSNEAPATPTDMTPPAPDPMTWETVPSAVDTTSISMTATLATDANDVLYYFKNVTITDGTHDSGWQTGRTYTDTGLSEATEYTYRVQARDESPSQNTTALSDPNSATTIDVTPPTPDPMTWATVPYATGATSISMTATSAIDNSGGTVEYYFTCTAGGGNNSNWQLSTTYED